MNPILIGLLIFPIAIFLIGYFIGRKSSKKRLWAIAWILGFLAMVTVGLIFMSGYNDAPTPLWSYFLLGSIFGGPVILLTLLGGYLGSFLATKLR